MTTVSPLSPPPEINSGAVTSRPLTTTFTPAIGCRGKFRANGPILVAYGPGYGLDIDARVECAPPAVTTWREQPAGPWVRRGTHGR